MATIYTAFMHYIVRPNWAAVHMYLHISSPQGISNRYGINFDDMSSTSITGDAAALLGAAANGASLSIGRLLLLAPYHVPVFTYSFVVTGGLRGCCTAFLGLQGAARWGAVPQDDNSGSRRTLYLGSSCCTVRGAPQRAAVSSQRPLVPTALPRSQRLRQRAAILVLM